MQSKELIEIPPPWAQSVDEAIEALPNRFRPLIERIRSQKATGNRPMPSSTLIDKSSILTRDKRHLLLDKIASAVDQNWCGRSEMCQPFALLLENSLNHLGLPATAVVGESTYLDAQGGKLFSWQHAWVKVLDEVIDGNVDSTSENPEVPSNIRVRPYWGPDSQIPTDRLLNEFFGELVPTDVPLDHWWPSLKLWLDEQFWSSAK